MLHSQRLAKGKVRLKRIAPLEKAMRKALKCPRIAVMLIGRQADTRGRKRGHDEALASLEGEYYKANSGAGKSTDEKLRARIKELENSNRNLRNNKGGRGSKQSGKGGKNNAKGNSSAPKGKGKGKTTATRPPQGLQGKEITKPGGKRVCFAYSLHGCTDASPGGRCHRGWHLCAEPGCAATHSLSEHP